MCQPFTYKQTSPSSTILYQTVRDYWPEFKSNCEIDGHGLPDYVVSEFDEFLKCGELYYGFTRRVCQDCQENHFLPFSCKKRSFCPRCISRKSAETTLHLLENIIPKEQIRQWVVTLPVSIRYLIARNTRLQNKVHKIIIETIEGYYKGRVGDDALPGAITFIQRFGSALNLNIHYHVAFLDGAYVKLKTEGELLFRKAKDPRDSEVGGVLSGIVERVVRLLKGEGILDEEGELLEIPFDELLELAPSLAKTWEASVSQTIALGPRAGFSVRKIGRSMGYYEEEPKKTGKLVAAMNGFTIHAARRVKSSKREELRVLLSYMSRPPVAKDRLSRDEATGDLIYELKRPFNDGTTAIRLSAHEFIEKLVALVAPPGQNLVRYSGVFAPNSAHRKDVILADDIPLGVVGGDGEGGSSRHIPWAVLMKKIYGLEMDKCLKCNGPMKVVSVIEDRDVIDKILSHIGHSTDPAHLPQRSIPEPLELFVDDFP